MDKKKLQELVCKAADALCELSDYVNSAEPDDEVLNGMYELASYRDMLMDLGFSQDFAESLLLANLPKGE